MVEKRFGKLGIPDIERFENYLPTAFSSELTLLQKVNKIIQDLIESNKLTNEMVDYLNNFVEKFDEKLFKTIEDVLQVWLNDGVLADIVREAINEEVVEARTDNNEITYSNLKERLDIENNLMLEIKNEVNEVTRLFGNVDTFRKQDETIIEKIKNEFGERGGTNVCEFGVVADGVTDDSVALQKAFDAEVDLIFPNKTIYLKSGVWGKGNQLTYTFYNTKIVCDQPVDYILKIGAEQAPNFITGVSLIGVCRIEGRSMAKVGLLITNARVDKVTNFTVTSCTERNYYITKSPSSNSWVPICSANLIDCTASADSSFNWQTSTGVDNVGLEINTDDCYIFNMSMVHQKTAIVNRGGNTFERVHAWLINEYQLQSSVFADLYSGSQFINCFADTYTYEYQIRNKLSLNLNGCRDFWNQQYYPLQKVVDKVLPYPIVFRYMTEASKATTIKCTGCAFNGLIDGGGYLKNTQEYLTGIELTSTTLGNLKDNNLVLYKKELMTENWENTTLKTANGSSYIADKDQIVSVTLKPFTLKAENMSGNFLGGDSKWYAKNSGANLSFANNIMSVTGNGKCTFAGEYVNVDYHTFLFTRFRIKCSKECIIKLVNRDTGITIGTQSTIYVKEGWHDEYYMFEIPQTTSKIDIEVQIFVNTTGTEANTIEITEFTMYDIMKRKIGYMFETFWDLASRLAEYGFVLNERVLPLPTNQNFVIKSFPKNYGCKMVVNETSSTAEYTAYRSLEGLVLSAKAGSSSYKTFSRKFSLPAEARLRGNIQHYVNTLINSSATKTKFPENNTFSDDFYTGLTWKGIHFFYKNKTQNIPVSRDTTEIRVSKLLTSNENIVGNRCTITEEMITPVTNPKVFTTPHLTSESGYYKLPVFKGGEIVVHSDGGGFADVEIIYGE